MRHDTAVTESRTVEFRVHPAAYRHWRLSIDGPVATLAMDVDEQGGLVPGYELKLNSYDLGVDIELYDAVQRLRFEHPEVRAVVLTSAKDTHLLRRRQHPDAGRLRARVEGELLQVHQRDPQRHRGRDRPLRTDLIAALNGTASGGGYELALACEHIMLVDDRSSAVSLPELPLLGVLPGTGGLTRVVDKRARAARPGRLLRHPAEGVGGREGGASGGWSTRRCRGRGGRRPSRRGRPSSPRAPTAATGDRASS